MAGSLQNLMGEGGGVGVAWGGEVELGGGLKSIHGGRAWGA